MYTSEEKSFRCVLLQSFIASCDQLLLEALSFPLKNEDSKTKDFDTQNGFFSTISNFILPMTVLPASTEGWNEKCSQLINTIEKSIGSVISLETEHAYVRIKSLWNHFGETEKQNIHEEDLYCWCREVDFGLPMVCCDACDKWFHGHCVNFSEKKRVRRRKQQPVEVLSHSSCISDLVNPSVNLHSEGGMVGSTEAVLTGLGGDKSEQQESEGFLCIVCTELSLSGPSRRMS